MMLRAFLLATAILTSLWSQANAGDCAPKQEAHFWELDDASNGNDFNPEVPDSVRDPTQFPLLLTESCGRQVSIAQAFRRGPIRVPLGSGRHLNYLPIFLQDKTSWSCQRIKPRIACVTDSQADGSGGRILTLRSEMADPNRIMPAAQLRIDSNGRVVTINDYFTLIPLQMQVGDTVYDVRDRIQRAMDNVRCSGDCKSFKGWAADRRIVEIVRYARLSKLPRSEVKKDVALFMDKVGELNKHAQALQALIGANEISLDVPNKTAQLSPFEITDAVDGNSGPSFGTHQIDVATNACNSRRCDGQPFRDALERLRSAPTAPAGLAAAMASAAAKRTRLFEKPIRLYSPEELGLLHRSAAQITAELRSETGRAQYLKLYSDYLRTDTGCMSLLRNSGSPFASHLGTRLYAVDVKNQFGSGSWLVRKARNSWSADQSDEQAFQAMLREVRENTKQGREHLSDVIRRQDNLKRVLTLFDASISGGSPTDCNAKF